jgi:WD40 repeat protein
MPDQNLAPSNIFSKQKHFCDHDDQVSSIFIHQDMQYFATSSVDGTCNLYNLWKLVILRCFKHPSLNPLSTVILSNQPLVSLAMFSPVDKVWVSFSINGQNLNELEKDPEVLTKNYSEESSQIVAPKVI